MIGLKRHDDEKSGDPQGRGTLHQAVVEGDANVVARLISDGVDLASADNMGNTALHLACQQEQIEVSRLLIEAGAPVDPIDAYGNTPLWRAVFAFQGGDLALVRLLLDAGADPDRKNYSDRSPRDMALTFDRPGMRALLG